MESPTRRDWIAAGLSAAAAARLSFAEAPDDLASLTLKQASDGIRSKKVSPVELTEACLASIKTYNPKNNEWRTVMRDKALAQAKELEKEQKSGSFRSPLHGIPIGIKDSIDTIGVRTTAASAVYEYRFPTEDAEGVRRPKAAGAILIGKCNMHEFDPGAMNNCFASLGTDSGGAIRTPSSYCGVVGFKPTYGRVSLRGIIPFSWSLDHCGPIARTVEDSAMVL